MKLLISLLRNNSSGLTIRSLLSHRVVDYNISFNENKKNVGLIGDQLKEILAFFGRINDMPN